MKLPKLKYYYLAMPEDQYREFENTRLVETSPVAIDTLTGVVHGRPYLTLTSTAGLADDLVRQHYGHTGPVFVLRIARDCIDRRCLQPQDPDVYHYGATLHLPHCGVYRYDLDKASATPYNRVIAAAEIRQIPSTQLSGA